MSVTSCISSFSALLGKDPFSILSPPLEPTSAGLGVFGEFLGPRCHHEPKSLKILKNNLKGAKMK